MNISKVPLELLDYISILPVNKNGCVELRRAFNRALPMVKNIIIALEEPKPFNNQIKVVLYGNFTQIAVSLPMFPAESEIQCEKIACRIDDFLDSEGKMFRIPPEFHPMKISHTPFVESFLEKPFISTEPSGPTNVNVLEQIQKELKSRGDYELDIPKLVDKLFVLGVIKPKED